MNKVNCKIRCAVMDLDNEIKIFLNDNYLNSDTYSFFINNKEIENFGIDVLKDRKTIIIKDIPNIIASDILEIKINDKYYKVILRNFLNKFYYDKDDLGVTFDKNRIRIKIWAPTAYRIQICLYNYYNEHIDRPCEVYEMSFNSDSGVYDVELNKINKNKYYLFKLYFKYRNDKEIDLKVKYAIDPYAKAVSVNGEKGVLLDINDKELKPKYWENDKRPFIENMEDTILYEMHIRDFTIDENSGVSQRIRGKFLGAVQEGTFYIDKESKKKCKTGIDHLKELGITHVHIMPCFDFDSVDEKKINDKSNRNWGYDPKNYNVPEGSYATNPYKPNVRIIEFREMVKKFHANGIRVVMDVVYNHMASTENLENIVPYYYFRIGDFCDLTNGSGCGNELATERPMVRKLIVDSIIHWVKNYNIDGFRFDLMELIDKETIDEIVLKVKEIDKNIIIYGEPWKADYSPLKNGTYKGSQKGKDFSIFNDTFRDAIRGDNSPSWGYINCDAHNRDKAWSVIEGLKGSIYTITKLPRESINYVSAHDNYTLWDQIEKSMDCNIENGQYQNIRDKNIFENYKVRQLVLGVGIILTAQGIPFLHSGVEFLRSKQGDHNSYRSLDNINKINWADKIKYYEVFSFIKGLIKIRKGHKAFRKSSDLDIRNNQNIFFINNDENSGVIISHLYNNSDDIWKNILVIYNATSIDDYDVNYKIPKSHSGKWNIVVNNKYAGENIIDTVDENNIPKIKSHSMLMLFE